ncbi:hypothetical protein EFA69_06860 [Rufibacter immobilis]|uniref:Uncharacterized protein n=1 Tax=Rufibacter immobilis TaxID=1348778 RepID=A0A3M9MZ43_9BACT|nr:hypothetical protein EFA69_06860 [Rufibacter immobilis]
MLYARLLVLYSLLLPFLWEVVVVSLVEEAAGLLLRLGALFQKTALKQNLQICLKRHCILLFFSIPAK